MALTTKFFNININASINISGAFSLSYFNAFGAATVSSSSSKTSVFAQSTISSVLYTVPAGRTAKVYLNHDILKSVSVVGSYSKFVSWNKVSGSRLSAYLYDSINVNNVLNLYRDQALPNPIVSDSSTIFAVTSSMSLQNSFSLAFSSGSSALSYFIGFLSVYFGPRSGFSISYSGIIDNNLSYGDLKFHFVDNSLIAILSNNIEFSYLQSLVIFSSSGVVQSISYSLYMSYLISMQANHSFSFMVVEESGS